MGETSSSFGFPVSGAIVVVKEGDVLIFGSKLLCGASKKFRLQRAYLILVLCVCLPLLVLWLYSERLLIAVGQHPEALQNPPTLQSGCPPKGGRLWYEPQAFRVCEATSELS